MISTNLKRLLIAAYVAMLAIILGLGYISQRSTSRMNGYITLLALDHDVVKVFQDILLSVERAESNRRGFVITEKTQYLASYNDAVKSLQGSLQNLRQLNTHGIYADSFLDSLESRISDRVQTLQNSIHLALNDTSADSIQVALTEKGRESTRMIRGTVIELLNDRGTDRSDIYRALEQVNSNANDLSSTILTVTVLSLLGFAIVTYHQVRKSTIIEEALRRDILQTRQQVQHATQRYEELRKKLDG